MLLATAYSNDKSPEEAISFVLAQKNSKVDRVLLEPERDRDITCSIFKNGQAVYRYQGQYINKFTIYRK
jgi:hypothetical protein